MKQVKLNNILYVLDTSAYIITEDTDVDIINVPYQCYTDYKRLNPTLTQITAYNYAKLVVQIPDYIIEYNRQVEEAKKIKTVFNITDISEPTQILGTAPATRGRKAKSAPAVTQIEIDGKTLPNVVNTYQFTTIGEHVIKYKLSDPTTPPDYMLKDCFDLKSIELGEEVETTGKYLCSGCYNLTTATLNSVIKTIDDHAFDESDIATISIPSTCTKIGIEAFDAADFINVVLPDSITEIGDGAFQNCSDLVSINIPENVTIIPDNAFKSCASLTGIVIPNGVTSIGEQAFAMCTSLQNVTIPNGVTEIKSMAFRQCNLFTTIDIPASVTSLAYDAYQNCSNIAAISVNNSNTIYDSRNNCNAIVQTSSNKIIIGCKNTTIINTITNIGQYAFEYCSGLTSITIPDSVTTIGDAAFIGTGISEITISEYVTSIGDDAFRSCSSLATVNVQRDTPATLGTNAFDGNKSGRKIIVPAASVNTYKAATNWSDYADYIEGDMVPYDQQYLTIESLEDDNGVYYRGNLGYINLFPIDISSDNGETWETVTTGSDAHIPNISSNIYAKKIATLNNGDKLLIRGLNNKYQDGSLKVAAIICSKNFNLTGNIMSLIYGDNFYNHLILDNTTNKDTFASLFYFNDHLINAENLILPATTVASRSYASLFQNCFNLLTPPELPATTLNENCYGSMFIGCSSLTRTPSVLPATTLPKQPYDNMFAGCSSLTTIPSGFLPATNLGDYCYRKMFLNCSGITTVPADLLPATQLKQYCYDGMFNGCSSLTTIPADLLPITSLKQGCYGGMFAGCTSLTSIPSGLLPATTVPAGGYQEMFAGCTSLTTISNDLLPATTLSTQAYMGMFSGCSSLTHISGDIFGDTLIRASRIGNKVCRQMFMNCTSLTTAPDLSAVETVDESAFESFLEGCTSLTVPAALNVTTPAKACYKNMMKRCTSLVNTGVNYCNFTKSNYDECCYGMFEGCVNLTTAYAIPGATPGLRSFARMFYGCTSLENGPIILANNLTSISNNSFSETFMGCTHLTTIKSYQNKFDPNINYTLNTLSPNWLTETTSGSGSSFYLMNNDIDWNYEGVNRSDSGIPTTWTIRKSNGDVINPKQCFTCIWSGSNLSQTYYQNTTNTFNYSVNTSPSDVSNEIEWAISLDQVTWSPIASGGSGGSLTIDPTSLINTATAGIQIFYLKTSNNIQSTTYVYKEQTFTATINILEPLDLDLSHYTRLDNINLSDLDTSTLAFYDAILDCTEAMTNGNAVSVILRNIVTGQTSYSQNRIQTATNLNNITFRSANYKFQTNGTELPNNPGFYAYKFTDLMWIKSIDGNTRTEKVYFKFINSQT